MIRSAVVLLLVSAATVLLIAYTIGMIEARLSREGLPSDSLESHSANSGPRFESLSVSELSSRRLSDDEATRHWCGPLGVGRFRWTIAGGASPLKLTIAGQLVDAYAESVDIPCSVMRDEYLSGTQPDDSVVDVLAVVVDSDGQSDSTAVPIAFVSDAPRHPIEGLSIFAGIHDAFFSIEPWSFIYQPFRPIELMALVRYREVGSSSWRYAIPVPAPPQNWCGYWCFTPHVSDLAQNGAYEYQAAWMWMELPWEWRERLPPGEAWWRSWTTPDAMNWTETRIFQTYGVEDVLVKAEDHSLTVSWQSRGAAIHTWLTSPDWPGAIWTDPVNPYRRPIATTEQENGWSTSVFRGLPSDTTFKVTFKRALPDRFAQAEPQEYLVQTKPADSDSTPDVFDHHSVRVAIVDDELHVGWNGHLPNWWVTANLYAGNSRIGRPRLAFRRIASLSTAQTGEISVQRQEMVFRSLLRGSPMVLYLNLQPWGRSALQGWYPFVCMAWEVKLAPVNPELHLDRYFHSTWSHSHATIEPVKSYWLSADGNWPYSKCVLGDAVGP